MELIIALLWLVIIGGMAVVTFKGFTDSDNWRSDLVADYEFRQLEDVDESDAPHLFDERGDWLDFPSSRADWRWYHLFVVPLLTALILLAQIPVIKYPAEWVLDALLDLQWNTRMATYDRRMKKWRREKVEEARRRRELGIETPVRKERPTLTPLTEEMPVETPTRRRVKPPV